jgi:uncharacterized protein (DUF362 family)
MGNQTGNHLFSRRGLLKAAGAAAAIAPPAMADRPLGKAVGEPMAYPFYSGRSTVSVVTGNSRRKNITDALAAIDDQIRPVLKQKDYVVIKPNGLNATKPLACSHADALLGVLDYLAARYKKPVIVAESSGHSVTGEVYENFGYAKAAREHRALSVRLVDLNEEARYEVQHVLDFDLHPVPIRVAARLLDPRAYVICLPVAKTHLLAGVTLSVKNMTLGAPLHQSPKETVKWDDKRRMHPSIRVMQYNMLLLAQRMKPFWGATVIDAWEGMEGNGPASGTPIDHRVAVASTDYLAADRVMLEAMGMKAESIGHLLYCWRAGLGQYDLAKIDVRGEQIAAVRKPYRLPADFQQTLEWTTPVES